jgi:hypothetical protein
MYVYQKMFGSHKVKVVNRQIPLFWNHYQPNNTIASVSTESLNLSGAFRHARTHKHILSSSAAQKQGGKKDRKGGVLQIRLQLFALVSCAINKYRRVCQSGF